MVARALVLTRRSAETDSFKHVELGTGYGLKPDSNQPIHGFEEWFSMGWLRGLSGLKPDHVQGDPCATEVTIFGR